MIFPSTAGTWRDPDNFRARWREVRQDLGVPDATSHSFRKKWPPSLTTRGCPHGSVLTISVTVGSQ